MPRTYLAAEPRSRRRQLTLAGVIALYAGISIWLYVAVPGLFKIFPYAIPFLALIAALSEGKFTVPPHAAPYLVLVVVGCAMAPLNSTWGWQDLYLMLMGLTPFCFGHRYRWSWSLIFWASMLATVVSVATFGRFGAGVEFSFAGSRSSFESPTSFVFGLLALWAAMERRWGRVIVALLLCLLTLKRIIVIASVVTILVMLLPAWFRERLLRPVPMIALNALFLFIVVLYTRGHFDQLILAFSQQSADQLGMGRQALYSQPVSALVHDPARFALFGLGPGSVYTLLTKGFAFFGKPNLHNDSLKILVEYGGVVWLLFFAALYRRQPLHVRMVMLFSNIVLLTDNSLIYPYFIFAIGLVLQNVVPVLQESVVAKAPEGRHARVRRRDRPAAALGGPAAPS